MIKRTVISLILLCFLSATVTNSFAYTPKQHRMRSVIVKVSKAHGFKRADTDALLVLAKKESTYRATARNGRYKGLFQLGFNDMGTRWKSPIWNTRRAIKYIKHRYSMPRRALAHHYRYGWY